jgi:hypothetical protein
MRFVGFDPAGRPILSLPIYYDVRESRIRLDTFVGVAKQYEALIHSLAEEIFGQQIIIQVYVLPPEEGSLRQVLGVVVIAGMGGILGTGGWEMARGFINGLSGQSPEEWSQQLGEELRNYISSEAPESLPSLQQDEPVNEIQQVVELTSAVVEASQHFASNTTRDLTASGFNPDRYADAFNAKTKLFQHVEADIQINGIGFGHEREAPIRREDFGKYQIRAKREDEPDEWILETATYRVSSPNWDRYDGRRKWKGRDREGGVVYFVIIDEAFWELANSGGLDSNVIDELVAQVAIKVTDGRKGERYVLRVIRFNDRPVSKELTPRELNDFVEKRFAQSDFFDEDNLL